MQLPEALLHSLDSVTGFDKAAFVSIHESPEQVTSIRMNPGKLPTGASSLSMDNKIPWTEYGYYLPARPSFTFDPLFHAGCYYVQEASSMFLEQAIKQAVDLSKPLKLLDLCAAPGGKSTHLLSLVSKESLLVSNEVIRARANILRDNIVKWGSSNVAVTNNDPRDFQQLKNYFDVIVADAPCSGSGLFRRDEEAVKEWSLSNVALCSQRQQRILADILPALKPGGLLIYSTCSYSREEDEDIVKWLEEQFPVIHVSLSVNPGWNIIQSGGGYRFWPDKLKGEGFFIACFRKQGEEDTQMYHPGARPGRRNSAGEKFSKQEMEALGKYVKTEGLVFLRNREMIHAVPEKLLHEFMFLLSALKVVYCGTKTGEIIKDKLVPDHALAMSSVISENVKRIELTLEQAIAYLQKKELKPETGYKGWALVSFMNHPLGWVNILPGRVNNYYPKELRILKQ